MTMEIDNRFTEVVRGIQQRQEKVKQAQDQIKADIAYLAEQYGVSKSDINKAIKLSEKELKKPGTIHVEESVIDMARHLSA